uniref:Transmembrane protein n=1 Tax=Fagus sylvatica TaxID=28930 RepID=A0A2N9IIP2_FAGSY
MGVCGQFWVFDGGSLVFGGGWWGSRSGFWGLRRRGLMVGVSGSKLGKAKSGVARLDGNGHCYFRRGLMAMVVGVSDAVWLWFVVMPVGGI